MLSAIAYEECVSRPLIKKLSRLEIDIRLPFFAILVGKVICGSKLSEVSVSNILTQRSCFQP